MTVIDITPRDDSPPPVPLTTAQIDAARFASKPSGYADAAALDKLRDAAVGRVVFHMTHHEPSPDRWRRCAEMLALAVENQLRTQPGGRLFLANRDNWIERTWWETS